MFFVECMLSYSRLVRILKSENLLMLRKLFDNTLVCFSNINGIFYTPSVLGPRSSIMEQSMFIILLGDMDHLNVAFQIISN
jgi:hypothetical protein